MVRNVLLTVVCLLMLGRLLLMKHPIGSVESRLGLQSPLPDPVFGTTSATAGQGPPSGIAAKLSNRLLIMGHDGQPHGFDSSKLSGVKYWAFYYSASWCETCRQFTQDLVSFYRDFKPGHPDFELIFVNLDRSDSAMIRYMKTNSMPWPAVWFSDTDNPDLNAKKYYGLGMPCLALVDNDGQVLSDTFQNGHYTDPHHVIDDIRSQVR
jgi:thiol-disulfide isomerase/thioredoxin